MLLLGGNEAGTLGRICNLPEYLIIVGSGGAQAAGSAVVIREFIHSGQGGALASGSALLVREIVVIGSGGAIAAGAAIVELDISIAGRGGAIASGAAKLGDFRMILENAE